MSSAVRLSLVLLFVFNAPARGQESLVSISGGFAVPMDIANERIEPLGGDELTTGIAVPAIWGEAAFFPTSRLSLHSSIDLPLSAYDVHWHHVGTAGFDEHIKHYDTVVSQSIGFRSRSTGGTQVIGLLGFGLVFARSVEDATYPQFSTSGRTPTHNVSTDIDPSVVGGLHISWELNRRMGLAVRIHARATHRRYGTADTHYGWFSVTPGIGVSFR